MPLLAVQELEVDVAKGQFLEIHVPLVLMTAPARAIGLQACMALDTGKGRLLGHDLVVQTQIHDGLHPLVLAAVRQPRGLHATGERPLPIQGLPIAVRAEELRRKQVIVQPVSGLFASHELKWIDS